MKKLLIIICFVTAITVFAPDVASAQTDQGFVPLVDIPFLNELQIQQENLGLAGYANSLYRAAITIAAVLAVIKIVMAGVQYMLTDVVTQKSDAKKNIKSALLGLTIVIGAVLILNTINPNLTNLKVLNLKQLSGDIGTIPLTNVHEGENVAGTDIYINEGDEVRWVSDETECSRYNGTFVPGTDTVANRCVIRVSDREEMLPYIAATNCPVNRECRAELCDEDNLGWIQSCSNQCSSRNGIHYDSDIRACVFYNDSYNSTPEDVTVDTSTNYFIVQNEDQITAGDEPVEIEIIGTQSVGGLVEVRLPDGSTVEMSCGYITPNICN